MGFILGIVASLIAWAAIAWSLVPRLQISKLNRHPDPSYAVGLRYRIKVRNASWYWAIGDLRVDARLVIKGLDINHPNNRTSLVLPVADGAVFPALDSAGPPLKRRPHFDAERTFTFRVGELRGGGIKRLPIDINSQLSAISLDELVRILQKSGFDCYLRVAISATHGFSGVRRTRSIRAAVEELETGDFEPGSVRIVSPVTSLATLLTEMNPEGENLTTSSSERSKLENLLPSEEASEGEEE